MTRAAMMSSLRLVDLADAHSCQHPGPDAVSDVLAVTLYCVPQEGRRCEEA